MVAGWFSFSTPVLAWALFSFTSLSLVMLRSMVWQIRSIPVGGVMSSAAVAVVLLGFHFWERPVRSCISWKRYVDDVVVGSRVFCCSCIFVFIRACYPVPLSLASGAGTAVHTWVDVELRVIGSTLRSISRIRVGHGCRIVVHSRSRPSFPGLVFLKVDWVAFGVWCWSIWQEPRCWGSRNNLGWLVSWKTLWNWCVWLHPLSVIRGLVHSLPCSRVVQICRKTVRTWVSLRKNRMVDDKKDQRQKPRGEVWWPQSLGGGIVVEAR